MKVWDIALDEIGVSDDRRALAAAMVESCPWVESTCDGDVLPIGAVVAILALTLHGVEEARIAGAL